MRPSNRSSSARLSALSTASLLLFAAPGAGALAPVHAPESPSPRPAAIEPITPAAPPEAQDPRRVALGRDLFEDPRLSRNRDLSCASCHDVRTNGAGKGQFGGFNTPTVFNAARNFRLGWEGRFRTPEAQFRAILGNPQAMGLSVPEALGRIRSDPVLSRRFVASYGRSPDEAALLDAVATYERTLVTPDSRFDQWLKGRTSALTAQERRGYALFKQFGCVSCHQGRNIGGNLYARQGVFHPLASPKPHVLRVPSLRNVATTAPYFHDGSAGTLEEAVAKMARAQLDWTPTRQETQDIAAFLRSLTGQYAGRQVRSR